MPDQAGHHTPFHIWGDLVEKAGLKLDEIPKNWDGVWTYTKQSQAPLRSKGMPGENLRLRSSKITTVGPNDGNNLFRHFLIANGGEAIVTPSRTESCTPTIRRFAEAAIKSVESHDEPLQGRRGATGER